MNASTDAFTRIADLPVHRLASEEDVKNKIMLPLLRALGYEDDDFNYEGRTGRGYVDVVVERFPVGIVVETKSPRTKLTDDCIEQLEADAFHQRTPDRAATVAILTNAILCLKTGGMQGTVASPWFRACSARFLRPQIELVRPHLVACLGSRACIAVLVAYGVRPGVFRAAVESHTPVILPGGHGTRILGFYSNTNMSLQTAHVFPWSTKISSR